MSHSPTTNGREEWADFYLLYCNIHDYTSLGQITQNSIRIKFLVEFESGKCIEIISELSNNSFLLTNLVLNSLPTP